MGKCDDVPLEHQITYVKAKFDVAGQPKWAVPEAVVIEAAISGDHYQDPVRDQGLENARDRAREEALLAVGAGASAVHFSAYPEGAEQRCWNHRLMNVTDHLPKKVGPEAKAWLRKIPYADSRRECERLRDQIVECYGKLCPKAVDTLCRDWERMVSFCSFPMEHWCHLERPTW